MLEGTPMHDRISLLPNQPIHNLEQVQFLQRKLWHETRYQLHKILLLDTLFLKSGCTSNPYMLCSPTPPKHMQYHFSGSLIEAASYILHYPPTNQILTLFGTFAFQIRDQSETLALCTEVSPLLLSSFLPQLFIHMGPRLHCVSTILCE